MADATTNPGFPVAEDDTAAELRSLELRRRRAETELLEALSRDRKAGAWAKETVALFLVGFVGSLVAAVILLALT